MTVNGLNLLMSRRRLAPIFMPLLILVVLGLGICFHQQIKNQLNAWKLLPQPERLTELYFTDPKNLPSTYVPSQSQNVKFTTHNLEYQAETYQYKIIEQNQDGSQTQQLATGKFTLQQNQYKALSLTVTPVNMGARFQITIELPTVNESISYWNGSNK